MPFTYDLTDLSLDGAEKLKNISLGGLAFYSHRKIGPGLILDIKFPSLKSSVEFKGSVVWCDEHNGGFDIGVKFFNNGDVTQPEWFSRFIMLNIINKENLSRQNPPE